MGQNASQPKEEEDHDPNDDTLQQEHEYEHEHQREPFQSDDPVFSSQINSSIGPAFVLPKRPVDIKTNHSSSPTSHLRSSEAPTPIARRKMSSNSSLYHSSPPQGSSVGLAIESNNHETPPQLSKRKKRNKKRRSSATQPDEDHQALVPQPPTDLSHGDQRDQHEVTSDVNMGIDTVSTTSQSRSQHKKEKKESKRAAKFARQQAETVSITEPDQEPGQEESHFSEIWLSQERRIAAKSEQEEEEDLRAQMVEPQNTISKKRKRRKSQTQVEDEPRSSSKKHKKSYNATTAVKAGHDEQASNGATAEPEALENEEIDFNDLAEQLYSGRKRKFQPEVVEKESEPVVEVASEHEQAVEVMNADDHIERVESDLMNNGLVESEAASEAVEEQYRDDHVDYDYVSEDDSNRPENLDTEGEFTGHAAPGDMDGLAHDVEVPSSVPHPSRASGTSTKRPANSKANAGRKRVAKPDFFSRMVDDIDESINTPSPSAAALSRRIDKGEGKQIPDLEGEAQAGPSTSKGKARQPKITSMLKDGQYPDTGVAGTPTTRSVVRARTPKTPTTLSGAFSEFETRNLTQSIERFKDDYGMTQLQVNDLIHSNPKTSKAGELWERVTATCPGRSRQKVINQTRRRFHNFVARGTWTAEQDKELREMYEQYGNQYALIGQLINRHPEDIRDRVRNYVICGDKQRRDQWSQEETDRLVAIVQQAIAEIHQQRVKRGVQDSRPVEEDVNWQLVSQGMERTRSRLQCISKWKAIKPQLAGGGLDGEAIPLHQIIEQARETATTMSYRNRFLIIKGILQTGANADSRIPWLKLRNELRNEPGGEWTRPPLMVVWFRLRRTLPGWPSLNVKETCTLLMQNFQQTHKLEYPEQAGEDIDYDAEYRELEHKLKKGRKFNLSSKSAVFVDKASDDEDEEEEEEEEEDAIRSQLDATGEDVVEEPEAVASRHSSVDLSIGDKERVVEDSEPEAATRSHPRRRGARSRRPKPQDVPQDEDDNQSSDTNASQVSSIPAR
ncbi:hypothetical protein GGR55DRAFT_676309 [Xylaria sp. FL0064]|nr:hypothetical protein GGR55DRAFT_676309 [Xylaria sp. FL0064]